MSSRRKCECCGNNCTSNVLTGYASQANVSVAGYSPSTGMVDTFGDTHYYTLTALTGSLWNLVAPFLSATINTNASQCNAAGSPIGTGCYGLGYDSGIYPSLASANANWNDAITLSGGGSGGSNDYQAWHSASVSVQQKTTDVIRIAVRVYEATEHGRPIPAAGIRGTAYGCVDVPMVAGALPAGFWSGTYSIPLSYNSTTVPPDDATYGGEPASFEFGAGTASVSFS